MSFTKRQSSLQHMHARLGLGLLVALTLIFGVFYLYNGSSTPSHSDLPSDPIRSTHPGVDAPEGSGELRSPSQSGKATATGAVTVLVRSPKGAAVEGARVVAGDSVTDSDASGMVEVPQAPRELAVFHPDYAPWARRLAAQQLNRGSILVTLRPGATLQCRVLDQGGTPISGASVHVSSRGAAAPAARADWITSLRPAVEGGAAYHRASTTGNDGTCLFRGLALQKHQVVVTLRGYLHTREGPHGLRHGQAVDIKYGNNTVTVRLQRVYAQAIVIKNKTNLSQEIFRQLVKVSGTFPKGMTDLTPSMSEVMNDVRSAINKTIQIGARDTSLIRLARTKRPMDSQAISDDVIVRFVHAVHGKVWTVHPRWVPVDEFCAENVAQAVVEAELTLGRLRVASPYYISAHPVKADGRASFLSFGFEPSAAPGRTRALPVGRYLLTPRANSLLAEQGRSALVEVKKGGEATIDFHDASPVSSLRIRVTDASDSPTSEGNVKVYGLSGVNKGEYISFRPPDGKVSVLCEPGEYRIVVVGKGGAPAWERRVTLSAGKKLDYAVRLQQ